MPVGSRSGGERSNPERRVPTGVQVAGVSRPDPEVPAKTQRRVFSAQYKKKILEQAEACKERPGAMGASLRREGLCASHLASWRRRREKAERDGLSPKRRGMKAKPVNSLAG